MSTSTTSKKAWLDKFNGGGSAKPARPPSPLPPRQDRLVRPGSAKDAEAWRGAFVAAMRFESHPLALHAQLTSGIESQVWKLLCDQDGVRFRSFEHFCEARPPFGLGSEPEVVRAQLQRLLGPRSAAIVLAPPSNQGVRATSTSRPRGEKSNRHQQRLRAIAERAPEPVRKLCQLGLLSFKQAEALSPVEPPQERVAEIARFATVASEVLTCLGETPQEAQLAEAKRRVMQLLPTSGPTPHAVLRDYARMTAAAKDEFLQKLADELAREGRQLIITAVATAAE